MEDDHPARDIHLWKHPLQPDTQAPAHLGEGVQPAAAGADRGGADPPDLLRHGSPQGGVCAHPQRGAAHARPGHPLYLERAPDGRAGYPHRRRCLCGAQVGEVCQRVEGHHGRQQLLAWAGAPRRPPGAGGVGTDTRKRTAEAARLRCDWEKIGFCRGRECPK